MRIACLHTAWSNVAVFDAAARDLGLSATALAHFVEPRLLEDAEAAGGLTPALRSRTAARLLSMAADADAVLLTCSTLGPVVDALNAKSHVPILRADAALAVAAAAHHGKVAVLCAAATTVPATRTLFEHAASGSDAQIELTLVPNAWRCFKSGDSEGYQSLLVGAIERAYVDGASIVVLAQASMAPAAARCRLTPVPLTVPASALAAILAFLESPMTDSEYDVNQ